MLISLISLYAQVNPKSFGGSFSGIKEYMPDDVKIKGSLGLGPHMISGTQFGSNTMILRDENIRWYFHDDSKSTHPGMNWLFQFNDSVIAGNNYFQVISDSAGDTGIPLTIMAGAPDYSLYIKENSGFIGMGTSNPLTNLHIADDSNPTITFEQDGSCNWGSYIWQLKADHESFSIVNASLSTTPIVIEAGAPDSTFYFNSSGAINIGTENNGSDGIIDGDVQTSKLLLGYWTISSENGTLVFKSHSNKKVFKVSKSQ